MNFKSPYHYVNNCTFSIVHFLYDNNNKLQLNNYIPKGFLKSNEILMMRAYLLFFRKKCLISADSLDRFIRRLHLVHLGSPGFSKEMKQNTKFKGGEQRSPNFSGDSDDARVSNVSTTEVETTDQWERKVATALYHRKWTLASSTSVFTYKGTASSFICVCVERERER